MNFDFVRSDFFPGNRLPYKLILLLYTRDTFPT